VVLEVSTEHLRIVDGWGASIPRGLILSDRAMHFLGAAREGERPLVFPAGDANDQ